MAYQTIRVRLSTNLRQDGTKFIVIRYGGARCQTKLQVNPEHWDEKSQMITPQDKNYKKKNALLLELVGKLEEKVTGRQLSNEEFVRIYNEIAGKETKQERKKDLLDYWAEFEKTKAKPGTLKTYVNARKKIEEFDPYITFSTLNKGWLIRFESWLQGKGFKANYISIIIRCLRAVNNYCIDCEYTDVYPFRRFQIKQEETAKRCLTREQLIMLRDYPVEPHQEKYRDCFMLSFYLIGINMADLFELTSKNIDGGYLNYRRAKTSTLYNIKLEPEARAIIDANKGGKHLLSWADEWKYSNFLSRMNKELRRIGPWSCSKRRGCKKSFEPLFPGLSTYWARHTWATMASELNIPVDIIGRALGHADQSHAVTNIYIKFDQSKIDEANRKVLDNLLLSE